MNARSTVIALVAILTIIVSSSTAQAATRQTDVLGLEHYREITALMHCFHGEVEAIDKKVMVMANECVTHPELLAAIEPLAAMVEELDGNQKEKFIKLFERLVCLEVNDCEFAARIAACEDEMKDLNQRVRGLENDRDLHAPQQVLPVPPAFEPSPAEEDSVLQEQPRKRIVWTGLIHRVVPLPPNGDVRSYQAYRLAGKCVDVPYTDGSFRHGDVFQLANGDYVLVTHKPSTTYQPLAARY